LHDDRRADHGADAPLVQTGDGRRLGRRERVRIVEVLEPDGAADPTQLREGLRGLASATRRDDVGGDAPTGDHRVRAVLLEPGEHRGAGAEQPSQLLGDGCEDLLRRALARHERGDATQSRLFVGQAPDLGQSLGVGDRRSDQLGDGHHPPLGVLGEPPVPAPDAERAPEPPLHHDRRGDGRADTRAA
jgi:hypothetical protein